MSFIDKDDLKTEMTITSATDDGMLTIMAAASESLWDILTNKTWAETTHNETLNGTNRERLFLKEYPVISISKIGIGETGAISVTNTNTATYASVSVTSTGIVLNYNGTENSDIIFATYDTITKVANAITALDGWSATVLASFGDYISTELLKTYGQNCINNTQIYLNVPNDYVYDFKVEPETGTVYLPTKFTYGFQNINITYKAGYTDSTLPAAIKQTMIRQGCHWYRQAKGKNWDYTKIDKIEGGTIDFSKVDKMNLLPDFIDLAMRYRKMNV
jgi:hypothetical protein